MAVIVDRDIDVSTIWGFKYINDSLIIVANLKANLKIMIIVL